MKKSRIQILTMVVPLIYLSLCGKIVAQEPQIETERRAQAGMKFLSVPVDARSAAMGDAMMAHEGTSVAMFYNPAGIARLNGNADAVLGHTEFIADITYNMFGLAYKTNIGTFGISGVRVDYGELLETIRVDNEKGFLDVGTFNPAGMAVGLTYARALTNKFTVGGNVKYASQNLGNATVTVDESEDLNKKEYSQGVMAYDFGVLYDTGLQSLTLAMGIRNFAQDISFAEESLELPLTLMIGINLDIIDFTQMNKEMHSLVLYADAMHPRDYFEQIKLGGEYIFMNTLALRAGYIFPSDEEGLSAGVGIQQSLGGVSASFNYAFSQYGAFGNVNRFSIRIGF